MAFSVSVMCGSLQPDHLVGLVVKASTPRVADLGFDFHFLHGDVSMSSHTSDFKFGAPVTRLPCQAPGVEGLVLGLVGPVSVYCDWMR